MTLYLKYRPQTIDELDLTSVREALTKLLNLKDFPHAFLFAGSKGAGKTSAARIVAKIVNCEKNISKFSEPCNKCSSCLSIMKGSCLDVVELDAASHRGIDDIRTLKDSIMLSPSSVRRKVYIIDEAHMLTTEAANAFLKTLEEPPAHAIFILATTNPEKLPITIRSRTFVVQFEKATTDEISRQLKRVMKGEKLSLEDGVIELIAKASDGSFRDAVKILEQLSFETSEITLETTKKTLQSISFDDVEALLGYVGEKDLTKTVGYIEDMVKRGITLSNCIKDIIDRLHEGLLFTVGMKDKKQLKQFTQEEIAQLLHLFLDTNWASFSSTNIAMEVVLLEFIQGKTKPSSQTKEEKVKSNVTVTVTKTTLTKDDKDETTITQTAEVIEATQTDEVKKNVDTSTWNQILANVRAQNASIEALLRASFPMSFDGQNLHVGVYYPFHKERLELVTNMKTLEEVATKVIGAPVRIQCILSEKKLETPRQVKTTLTNTKDKDIIEAAKEIFGN